MNTLRQVWRLLEPRLRREAVWLTVLMTIGMLLEMLGVGIVLPAIVLLTGSQSMGESSTWLEAVRQRLGNPSEGMLVVYGLLAMLSVYTVKTAFMVYLLWRQTTFVAEVQSSTSQRLFASYLRQPWTFHLQRNSAGLIQNATGEVSQFTYLCSALLSFITESLVIAGIISLLIVMEPAGALSIAAVLGVATWVFQRLSRRRLEGWGKRLRENEILRTKHLHQGLGGAKDVKLFGRAREFQREFERHDIAAARLRSRIITAQQLPRLWYELLAVAGLVVLGAVLVGQGNSASEVMARIGLFAAAAFRVLPSANRMLVTWQNTRSMQATLDSLTTELSIPVPEAAAAEAGPMSFRDRITFRDVTFTYPAATKPSLRGVNLTICKGQSVGIVGGSGAGKSTLVDVMLGLLTPQVGAVAVDGGDIRTCLRSWQDAIGYVPQSIYLTDDTIRRNVAFGVPDDDIDDESVRRALRAAQLDDFVASLPDGGETLVGERGVRLSGGQRQRIGIARALYRDPMILVLDEATSSLDTATESEVMAAVNELHGSKTLIIVAHRLSTVAACDELIKLEHGEVAKTGRFGEVIEV
jgi:ABC-type multidrug transport system fused ATPase/permease subunit